MLGTDQCRQQQQDDADDHDCVFILAQSMDRWYGNQGEDHHSHRQEQPEYLSFGKFGSQTHHKGDTDAGKHEADWQDSRVGVGSKATYRQMREKKSDE